MRSGARADTCPAMAPDLHDLVSRERLELKRCLGLLAEAMTQADRWYARREADLAAFDRRATSAVDRLRVERRVKPSMAWNPA
jgi:hypothetical protein